MAITQIKTIERTRVKNQIEHFENDVNDFLRTFEENGYELIRVEVSYPIVQLNTDHTDCWTGVNAGKREIAQCIVYYSINV